MDESRTTISKEQRRPEMNTKLQKDDSFDLDVSKEQLEVRYKRYHDQFSNLQELLSKVTISVSRLESENNSLREQNEYLFMKSGSKKRVDRTKVSMKAPSAARAALEVAVLTIKNMKTKLVNFEKVALLQRISTDTAKQENEEVKATLEEMKKNLQQERKKNVHFQEKLNFMENECVKEATVRLAAERRLRSLQKEVQDLSDELSAAQCSEIIDHNHQRSDSDTDDTSPVNDNVLSTSTPQKTSCTNDTGTGKSFRNSIFILTSPTENKFQNVLSGMEEQVIKFGGKLKTFVTSRKSIIQSIKEMFKSKQPKMSTNYLETLAESALD